MITIDNFKEVLEKIGFSKDPIGDFFRMDYGECSIAVDFNDEKLIYPEDKGLIVNDRTAEGYD